jgi:immune inhibitor A
LIRSRLAAKLLFCLVLIAPALLPAGAGSAAARDPVARVAASPPGYLGVPAERAFRLPIESSQAAPFRYNVLVLLVEFSDVRADREAHPPSFYHRRFFAGTAADPSLADYYRANSGGRFEVQGLVSRWIRVDSTYAFYASEGLGNAGGGIDPTAYPHNVQRLVEDAVARVRDDFRWEDFDNDGDGFVDGLFIVHAGPGVDELSGPGEGGSGDHIQAHQFHTTFEVPVDGARVFDYAAADETARLGIVAHEFGHLLGLIDLYQAGRFAGPSGPFGLGDWSLMGTGALLNGARSPSNLDAWSRARLGFIDPVTIKTGVLGTNVTWSAASDDDVLRLWGAGGDSEYFLVEDRYKRGFDLFLPGEGVLIYHVDERIQTNTSSTHPKVKIEQADGTNDLNRTGGNRGDVGDPFPDGFALSDRDEFHDASIPNSRGYDATPSGVGVYNIRRAAGGFEANVVVQQFPRPRLARFTIREAPGGDGDGFVERGEIALVDVTVENSGSAVSAGDLFMAFTPDEAAATETIEPLVSGASIGNLGAGETIHLPGAFRFRFRSTAPDSLGAFPFRAIFSCSECVPVIFESGLLVPLGVPAGQVNDFESGAGDWTHASLVPPVPDLWHLTTLRAHSPTHSFAFAHEDGSIYDPGGDAALVSPPIPVPPGGRLSFRHWIEAESLATGRAWDGGLVEISQAGGPWLDLEPIGGYPFRVETGSGNPLFERRVFSGDSRGFTRAVFDLTPYAGSAVRFRFRFASDFFQDPEQNQAGWFIDDVAVTGQAPGVIASAVLREDGGVRVAWTLAANPPGGSGFQVLRRLAFDGAVAVPVGTVASTDGVLTYETGDDPAPGRYVYEVRVVETGATVSEARTAALDVPDPGLAMRLGVPFPSPFRASGSPATFEFFVPMADAGRRATLDVYDVMGRRVVRLFDGPAGAGTTRVQWTGDTASGPVRSGLYFLQLSVEGGHHKTRRFLVVS